MQCLLDYIGIKNCGFATSDSGMYLQDLPGMDFAQLNDIANADQSSYVGTWADIQRRAIRRFRNDVIGRISGFDSKYKLRQIAQTVNLGNTIDATSLTVASNTRRGHTIELNEKDAQCVCSNMQLIYVQSVRFYSTIAGASTLYVTDIDLHTDIYLKAFTAVIGWNTIVVETEFEVSRIAINVSSVAQDMVEMDLSKMFLGDLYTNASQVCAECSGGFNGSYLWFDWGCSCTAICQGYEIRNGDTTDASEVYGLNSYGISTTYSIKCTYNNVVCNNKQHFAQAFLYVLGIETLTERIYSSRINKWTTVDLQKAMELRTEFEFEYRGGVKSDKSMCEGLLNTIIYGIDLNLNDCCIQTDAPIRMAEPSF